MYKYFYKLYTFLNAQKSLQKYISNYCNKENEALLFLYFCIFEFL